MNVCGSWLGLRSPTSDGVLEWNISLLRVQILSLSFWNPFSGKEGKAVNTSNVLEGKSLTSISMCMKLVWNLRWGTSHSYRPPFQRKQVKSIGTLEPYSHPPTLPNHNRHSENLTSGKCKAPHVINRESTTFMNALANIYQMPTVCQAPSPVSGKIMAKKQSP